MVSPESTNHLGPEFITFSEPIFKSSLAEYHQLLSDPNSSPLKRRNAAEKLIAMNEGLIGRVAREQFYKLPGYFKSRLDLDDLLQVGRLTTYQALKKYKPNKGQWSTYLYTSLKRRMKTLIDQMRTLTASQRALNEKQPKDVRAFSLDATQLPNGTPNTFYDWFLAQTNGSFDPVAEVVLARESDREFNALHGRLRHELLRVLEELPSNFRKAKTYFLAYFVNGMSSAQVASQFMVTSKAVTSGLRYCYDFLWTNLPNELAFLKTNQGDGKKHLKSLLRILWPQVSET